MVITKDDTTIVDAGEIERITGRINQIRSEIETTDSDFDREKLQERLAKLAGGVAVIKVGAATETELKEKKHRVEDALSATRAALEEGIVPRRRRVLARQQPVADLLDSLDGDERTGARIITGRWRSLSDRLPRTLGQTASWWIRCTHRGRQRGLQRPERRVRGPRLGRCNRPDDGLALRPAERRFHPHRNHGCHRGRARGGGARHASGGMGGMM